LRVAFVVNRRVVGTVIGREARGALAYHGIETLQAEVRQRIVFAESAVYGRLVAECHPKSLAAREIALLTAEVAAVAS
jgi:chromosome partitioning protein